MNKKKIVDVSEVWCDSNVSSTTMEQTWWKIRYIPISDLISWL